MLRPTTNLRACCSPAVRQTTPSVSSKKVKSTSPAGPVFVTLLGDAYFKKGDLNRAEEKYLQALAVQQGNVEAVLGLARVAQNRGDAKKHAGLSRARGNWRLTRPNFSTKSAWQRSS